MSPLRAVSILSLALLLPAQEPSQQRDHPSDVRLPSGRLQRDEMLKADHARNIEDAQQLIKLSEELKADLDKNTEFVFSLATAKKVDEIEKIARRIRSRMKRY
jgi:hypothetical protein